MVIKSGWTREEDDRLKVLVEKGNSSREIGKIMGRGHSSVRWRAGKLGLILAEAKIKPNGTATVPLQSFKIYNSYRLYITTEYFLITYDDAELIKISRLNHHHRPGFVLLIAQLAFELLRGTRTALRERWAIWELEYELKAQELDLKCKAEERKVLEFWFERDRVKVKGELTEND